MDKDEVGGGEEEEGLGEHPSGNQHKLNRQQLHGWSTRKPASKGDGRRLCVYQNTIFHASMVASEEAVVLRIVSATVYAHARDP